MTVPRPTAPRLQPGYGVPADAVARLPWSWAEERLASARSYWLATVRADGRPHAMPVWGLWLHGALVFATDAASVKGRNLLRAPEAVVHLESGDEVVVLEGAARRLETAPPGALDAYEAKYGVRVGDDPNAAWFALAPRIAHTWDERRFLETVTRWEFPVS